MTRRMKILTAVAVAVALASAGVARWNRARLQRERMDLCLKVQASCLADSLQQGQAMVLFLSLARPRRADRTAALATMRSLRACWSYSSVLLADEKGDPFFQPLHQAQFWLVQTVHLGDDALGFRSQRDQPILKAALSTMGTNVAKERGNLLDLAAACRGLPWNADQAQALDQWAQSLKLKP